MTFYVDAEKVASKTHDGGISANQGPIIFGVSATPNTVQNQCSQVKVSKPLDGTLDEIALFGVALTQAQIERTILLGPIGALDLLPRR